MIETAIKEDLFLDSKLIIPENRMDAIRIMNELHPVVGGQPTNEKNQPNDNNPILDLACTILNIHESGVGVHADLRKIQNEPPKYFYGKGFMSGISSLKGNGILAVYGQWRDASGRYAIKQFYYTDKEILWRNAISDTAWSQWFDVLTGNSDLDYNKLLNVPITSTLSDDKTKIASIFAVNNVNRAAINAQKTANTANANAVSAMNEAKLVTNNTIGDGKYVRENANGLFSLNSVTTSFSDALDWDKPAGWRGFSNLDRQYTHDIRIHGGHNLVCLSKRNVNGGSKWIVSPYGLNKIYLGTTADRNSTPKFSELLNEDNTSIDSKGVIHEGRTTPTDVLLVGDHGVGTRSPSLKGISDFHDIPLENGFYTIAGTYANGPRGASPITYTGTLFVITRLYNAGPVCALVFREENEVFEKVNWAGNWQDWKDYKTSSNTSEDPSGFLRSFGNAVALTTDKLTSDLKVNRSDLVASAKYTYDVYQAALAADKKAVNAQTTANTAVANAKTAQGRADAAFSKVKPISEGGTGATTAAQGRKNMGHGDASTRNVATSLESNGNTLVPLSLMNNSMFGVGQKWVDVTDQRIAGSTYKNNTNKVIFISITINTRDWAAARTIDCIVDSILVASIGSTTAYGQYKTATFPVHPGGVYQAGNSQSIPFVKWAEFR